MYNVKVYGTGDGSTTFNVPNLSDGNGRFIRAGFTDDVIGTKLDDAIRNVTGTGPLCWSESNIGMTGCFEQYSNSVKRMQGGSTGSSNKTFRFDASNSVSTATEVRPYSIYALPLIAY